MNVKNWGGGGGGGGGGVMLERYIIISCDANCLQVSHPKVRSFHCTSLWNSSTNNAVLFSQVKFIA